MTVPSLDFDQVRAIILDVDGTLFDLVPVRRSMFCRLLVSGLTNPVEGFGTMRILREYRRAQEALRTQGRAISELFPDLALGQLQLASTACGVPLERVRSTVERWMEQEPLEVIPTCRRHGLLDFLDEAKSRGVALGVLSDYPADRKLAALGIRHYFDQVICAQDADVQSFKPDPRGLFVALNRMGVSAENALFVGDRAEVDGLCAVRAGMRGVIIGEGPRPVFPVDSLTTARVQRVNSFKTLSNMLQPQFEAGMEERVNFV